MSPATHRPRFVVAGLAVLLLVVLLVTPWLGLAHITRDDLASLATSQPTVGAQILWRLRVPRIVMGALAGIALSVAGAVFQATFRNPLADPFTLGVASGAAVGAALAFHLGWTGMRFGVPLLTLAAFVGAAVSVGVVYSIAGTWRRLATETLLLAGISIGFVCSAAVLLIEYMSREAVTNQTVIWLMGSLSPVGWGGVLAALPFVILGYGVLWYLHRDLDLLMMGELVAAGRGVSLGRARATAYFAASGMTAAVVAQCGPIAFVGLVIPHIVRAVGGSSHAFVLPASALLGAAFLVVCDTLASRLMGWLVGSPLQIPVGVVTNLIGGVFFLHLLLRRRRDVC